MPESDDRAGRGSAPLHHFRTSWSTISGSLGLISMLGGRKIHGDVEEEEIIGDPVAGVPWTRLVSFVFHGCPEHIRELDSDQWESGSEKGNSRVNSAAGRS
jgi:hypothetical protein